ncbi:dipicolinate synthase subunit A [Paenibacillus shirakamiensis]|uniref:Dipicolinate synthase subunit A n=1 Tax=Paenibacillus shirakamiensis TaxID=1265935 RepID=A0ABS4JH62_9BACL|nr:dipicolinate synthase subunit DpsA [Paenibacillus shirakamiensis]MBP2001064.1 dipicolinate synthase subunit A [Paenibacillus shirakamiensis]
MLTGLTLVFLGGDARQLEVIRKSTELDANVKVIGFDHLPAPLSGVMHESISLEVISSADVLVLPVVGSDEHGVIPTSFATEPLVLTEEHFAAMPEDVLIYTGMAKDFVRNMCKKYCLKLFEVLDRDDVAIYNSIPTAEGALMMAIQNTEITLHGSTCMVLGLGRTGFTLARNLQSLGATVKAGVHRDDHFARAAEMGWKPFITTDLADEATDVDLIFNTIPHMIITAQIISKMPQQAVIIDLASAPGGTDFRYAQRRGVKAMLAPGLPGIVAPKTAGIIMANCITQSIMDEKTRGDESWTLQD